jgi:hypothetical protein
MTGVSDQRSVIGSVMDESLIADDLTYSSM